MKKASISTDQAPAAIGPYSQAKKNRPPFYCSGQIPLLPNGQLAEGGVREQTVQVMKNLEAVVKAADATLDQVVKTTIYLVDMEDFAIVNEVYGACFGGCPPARATVQVAGLPKGSQVEIDAIVVL